MKQSNTRGKSQRGRQSPKTDIPHQGCRQRQSSNPPCTSPTYLSATLKGIPIVVVGTKLDLVNEREVQRATIQALASRWDLPFYETSAKRNWHIVDVFEDLVRQMRARYPPEPARRIRKRTKLCVIM
jgi:hypothetical protein